MSLNNNNHIGLPVPARYKFQMLQIKMVKTYTIINEIKRKPAEIHENVYSQIDSDFSWIFPKIIYTLYINKENLKKEAE